MYNASGDYKGAEGNYLLYFFLLVLFQYTEHYVLPPSWGGGAPQVALPAAPPLTLVWILIYVGYALGNESLR